MKKILSIVCSLTLMVSGLAYLIFQSPVAQAANVVLNPGFETAGVGGAADAADWAEGANHARAGDKFNTGSWSLKSTYRGTGTHTAQTVSVTAGTSYTYSVYIWKTTSVGGSCADMSDIAGELQLCVTTQTGSWQFRSGTWNSGTNTSVTLRLITDASPTGDIWFDDVSLDGGGAATNTPTNTAIPPTNTPTSTSVGPTATATPSQTPTNTSAPPTNTSTNTPAPPTNTPTHTPAGPTNTPAPSGNAVQNPSFETAGAGGAADAAGWTEGTNHARASDKFNTGAWSLKSSFIGTGGTHTAQTVSVATNTSYTYSGYIWRATTVGGSCLDMSDIVGEVQLCTTTTGSWQFKSGTWASGSNTSVTLRLITDGNPNNNVWFDDISLATPGTPVPTNTPTQTATPCGSCPTPTPTATSPSGTVIVAGAGDIACGAGSGGASCKQMATSDLLVAMNPDKIILLGDNQYESGALSDFNNFFHPSWGRLKSKISPAVGNHEYLTTNAAGYFDYFNGAGNQTGPAGDRSKGYYSYNVGAWHLIALNTECSKAGGCGVGSPQYNWLQSDLNAHPECAIAYTHHPRWTSDTRAFDDADLQPMLQVMYDKGVELLLVGHSHFYERFRRNDPNQNADPNYGIRQIIVGTGGRNVYGFGTIEPGSEVRDGVSFGVIKLTLRSNDYSWNFIPAAGYTFTDSGTEACHGPHP